MRSVRRSSEAEMVATFLAGELDSDRFGRDLRSVLGRSGLPRTLLTDPNLSDAEENEQRRRILGDFRGYGQDRDLFTSFPDEVSWQLVLLSPVELMEVLYIDYSYWTALTSGSRRPLDAAEFIRGGGMVFGRMPTAQFLATAEALVQGATWEPLICVRAGAGHPIVVLEGHQRLTAMAIAVDRLPREVPILLGTANAIADWPCY